MNQRNFNDTPGEFSLDFPTAYSNILERIDAVDPLRYSKTRNFTNGDVTYLSPYISRGVISLTQVKDAVLQKGYKPYQVEKFLQELAWREYFQRVWQHVGDDIWSDIRQPQPDVLQREMIEAIADANTGIVAMDNHINNMYETGYMHNHVRMYTASLACNIAKSHWLQPSRWLYYHLLDGDIASNNCSWQWVAGAFSSKKYYFNQENVNKFTSHNQRSSYLDKSYEEIMMMDVPALLMATTSLSLKTTLPNTTLQQLNTAKPTLIYNSYNLDAAWRATEDVNRVLLLEPSHFEEYPVSEKIIQFIINLSKNINGIHLYTGEIDDIAQLYKDAGNWKTDAIISKEHPAFGYYPGIKDSRQWMFPTVTGYHNSFFSFWKKCERLLK